MRVYFMFFAHREMSQHGDEENGDVSTTRAIFMAALRQKLG